MCYNVFCLLLASYSLSPSFDLERPTECDDEYWTHPDPAQAFKQPEGKPSRVSAFIHILKLVQILGFSLRTIVSVFHKFLDICTD